MCFLWLLLPVHSGRVYQTNMSGPSSFLLMFTVLKETRFYTSFWVGGKSCWLHLIEQVVLQCVVWAFSVPYG